MSINKTWFISITNLEDRTDFTNWLQGKLKKFNNDMEFQEWLDAYNAFPLQFYLDGAMYSFANRWELTLWQAGWQAAWNIHEEL